MSDAAPSPATADELPAPPRPVSPRVLRRAWAEPHVRFRWLFAALILLGGLIIGTTGFIGWQRDKSLLQLPPVAAKIKQTARDDLPGRPVPLDGIVLMEWKRDGQPVQSWGTLAGYQSDRPAEIGQVISIHVDPENQDRWTARNEPPSLMISLFPALVCVAVAALAFGLAWLKRGSVLRVWRNAPAMEAVVLGWQQSALAPKSRSAKCTLADEQADRTIFHVIVPAPAARRLEESGGQLQVLVPPQGRRLAVDWFA